MYDLHLPSGEVSVTHLVHHHSVAPPLPLLTHPPAGDSAEVVSVCLRLAVAGELVEHQEDHGVTAIVGHGEDVLGGVTGRGGGGGVVPLVRSLPGQSHVVLPQHPVGLEGQLINVSLDALVSTWFTLL